MECQTLASLDQNIGRVLGSNHRTGMISSMLSTRAALPLVVVVVAAVAVVVPDMDTSTVTNTRRKRRRRNEELYENTYTIHICIK